MTRKKTTKYALLSSVMAMVLSVAMLMGTTFAWFTDTASTAVNKIQAGTLDVGLEMSNDGGTTWENAEGETLEFIKAPGQENEPVLWEPGCTYELPQLRVVNKGNLALKYKLIITGINGDAQLNEAIEWTIDGLAVDTEYSLAAGADSASLTISGHMKEAAGNEYQGLSIDGIGITVIATQDTVEQDSNDNQYDKDATYLNQDADGNWLINTAAEMLYFANSVNNGNGAEYVGETVKLMANIDLAGMEWTPIGTLNASDGNGNPSFNGTFDGNGKTISNVFINLPTKNGVGFFAGNAVYQDAVIKNVTFDNATVIGNKWVGVVEGYTYADVINCTVKNSSVTANGYRGGVIVGFAAGSAVITGNKAIDSELFVGRTVSEANNLCVGTYMGNNAATNLGTNTDENCTFGLLVSDSSALIAALTSGGSVAITDDITVPSAQLGGESGYGKSGLAQTQGGIIDGNGNTISVQDATNTWDATIYTKGGTIRNAEITGGFRGIFIAGATEDIIIDNVIINPIAYAINCDSGNGKNLIVTNSTLKGWTSYAGTLASAEFTNCNFESNGTYAFMRPYATTTLTNCDFATGFELDATRTSEITLVNCTYNGTPITDANLTSLLGANSAGATVN